MKTNITFIKILVPVLLLTCLYSLFGQGIGCYDKKLDLALCGLLALLQAVLWFYLIQQIGNNRTWLRHFKSFLLIACLIFFSCASYEWISDAIAIAQGKPTFDDQSIHILQEKPQLDGNTLLVGVQAEQAVSDIYFIDLQIPMFDGFMYRIKQLWRGNSFPTEQDITIAEKSIARAE